MGTRFEAVLAGEEEGRLRAAGEEALESVEEEDRRWSLFHPGSLLSRINARAALAPVRLDAEAFDLLEACRTIHRDSEGAFDPTVAPLLATGTRVPGTDNTPRELSAREVEVLQLVADGQSNKGRVQAFDGPIYIADAALYLMHRQPDLAIKDPYELTADQYKAALDLLRQQRALVSRYWHDAMMQIDDFTNEGVVASSSWPFQVNLLRSKDQPIASVVPVEGATGWADTTMMHAEAPHPNCAYKWMEWTLSSNLQGDLAAWFGSVPVVLDACNKSELLGPEGCKTNGLENFARIQFWRTPVANCGGGRECVPYHEWVTSYIAVIGGR